MEQVLANRLPAEQVQLTHRGIAALEIALAQLSLQPGNEVVVSSMTYPGVADAILRCGGIPVLVDTQPNHFLSGASELRTGITSKTRAIIATHLFGMPCDVPAIAALAEARHCCLIEDCAQGLGSTIGGGPSGSYGDFTLLSFGFEKHLSIGRGGALLTRSTNLHRNHPPAVLPPPPPTEERAILLGLWLAWYGSSRSRYRHPIPDHLISGQVLRQHANHWGDSARNPDALCQRLWKDVEMALARDRFRQWWKTRVMRPVRQRLGLPEPFTSTTLCPFQGMGPMRSHFALAQWQRLAGQNEQRQEQVRALRDSLSGRPELHLPTPPHNGTGCELMQIGFLREPGRRNTVIHQAAQQGYEIGRLPWRLPLHLYPRLKDAVQRATPSLPHSEQAAAAMICLPTHEEVTPQDHQHLGDLIRRWA